MKSSAAVVLLTLAPLAAAVADPPAARIEVTRNAAGEVLATVATNVNPCGITALNEPPTFRVDGTNIEVTQPVAGIACMNPPPKERGYNHTLNLGKLAPGTYSIHWSFPQLTATYTVAPR